MRVKVTIIGAKNLVNQEFMGTSDPYCTCSVLGAEFKTKDIDNNLNPEWNHDGVLDWDGEGDMTFTVRDSNQYRADKVMGECTLAGSQAHNGFSGELTLQLDGKEVGKLKVSVDPPTSSLLPGGSIAPNITFTMLNSSLFLWEEKAKSGAVLGSVNLVGFAFYMFEFSILASTINIAMAAVGLGGVSRLVGLPLQILPSELIAKGKVGVIAEKVAWGTNAAVAFAYRIVLWQEQAVTVRTLAVVYVLRAVTRLMSLSLVAVILVNLLFVVAPLKKSAVAKHVEPLLKKGKTFKEAMLAKVPRYAHVASKDD